MRSLSSHRNLLLILGIVLGLNLGVGYAVYSKEADANGEKEAFEKVAVMMKVLNLIRQDYVDADKVGYTDLLYNATRGMVGTLDPFSDFLPPDEFKNMKEMTEGRFGGLGITITVRNGALTIIAPFEGSPAAKAGVLPGDQIRKIADTPTGDMTMQESIAKLKGEAGTKVKLLLFRPSRRQTLEVTIERAVIEVPPVIDAQVLEGGIGYLKIVEFSEPTDEKLKAALETLEKEKIRALVIDLRNNPGGLLESAVAVCSDFLPPQKLVVSTEGRRASQKQEFLTDSRRKFPDLPIAILINGGSASAAEIVAGSLQDWGRAVLVGEKSFGKGSVQNLIELGDGSALRLTTAHYYTPSHRIIHEKGIMPDIEVPVSEDEQKRLAEPDAADPARRVRPDQDSQLRRAMEVLAGYDTFKKAQESRYQQPKDYAAAPKAPPPTKPEGAVP